LRHQPYTEKQQEGVGAQLFAKVPQAQVSQQVPRQKGFGQFSQVVVKGLVMPGLDKGTAKPPHAVGQQQLADGLHAAALIQQAQPDHQRDQPHQRQQCGAQPVAQYKAFIDQAFAQQKDKDHHARQCQAQYAFTQSGNGNAEGEQQPAAPGQAGVAIGVVERQQGHRHAQGQQGVFAHLTGVAPKNAHGCQHRRGCPGQRRGAPEFAQHGVEQHHAKQPGKRRRQAYGEQLGAEHANGTGVQPQAQGRFFQKGLIEQIGSDPVVADMHLHGDARHSGLGRALQLVIAQREKQQHASEQ